MEVDPIKYSLRRTSYLIIGQLVPLISRLPPCQAQEVDVPLIGVFLEFSDLQSWLYAKLCDTCDGYGATLSLSDRRGSCWSEFFNLM